MRPSRPEHVNSVVIPRCGASCARAARCDILQTRARVPIGYFLASATWATDPAKADEGTIRKDFGESIEQNAIHGSDSDENANIEIAFFFSTGELL